MLGNFLLTVTPGATRRQVGGFLSHGATPRSHPIFCGGISHEDVVQLFWGRISRK